MDDKTIVEIATAKMQGKCLPHNLQFKRQHYRDETGRISQSATNLVAQFGTWFCRKCGNWEEMDLFTSSDEDTRIYMWRKIHA